MSTADDILTLTHATERDVDLLLVEELKCSPDFVAWMVHEIERRLQTQIRFERSMVSHSKRRVHNRREIDITLTLLNSSERVVILIENKLDTTEQFQQAESYRDEVATLVATDGVTSAHTVLICPQAYAASNSAFISKFDCNFSYEEIADFVLERAQNERGELADRLNHRNALLLQAVTKARRGYEAVPMVQIDAFNAQYVALLREETIALPPGPSMLKEGRPGESKTMIFSPNALPRWKFLPQMRLVHQLREGNANICFSGWGNHFSQLAGIIATALAGSPYRIVPTINKRAGGNSGLMIVADTPQIDNLLGFDAQRSELLEGMRITQELRDWFRANQAAIERWAAKVTVLNN